MSGSLTLRERIDRVISSLTAYAKRDRSYLARIEFWIYLPGESLPSQEEIMNRMMLGNPYGTRGVSPIGTAEGILFSDVRTHLALVLKSHNPQVFRGSNFPLSVRPSKSRLDAIAGCNSIVKVSYISEEPLTSLSHVSFITHATDAVADLGNGILIYDLIGEQLRSREELEEELRQHPKGDSADFHVRTQWEVVGSGSRVETRGLRKLGIPDLRTMEMGQDQHVVTEAVVTEAASAIWSARLLPQELEVELFGDRFKVQVARRTSKFAEIRILRHHPN